MFSATKIRLYPTPEQKEIFAKAFGCARWLWNNGLAETQKVYKETGKGLKQFALNNRIPELKKEFPWLSETHSQVLRAAKNLKRQQHMLSRKTRGSKTRNKARILLAKAHEKTANARNDHLHKLSHRLVNENQVLAVEDLHVKGMMKNH